MNYLCFIALLFSCCHFTTPYSKRGQRTIEDAMQKEKEELMGIGEDDCIKGIFPVIKFPGIASLQCFALIRVQDINVNMVLLFIKSNN